MHVFTVVIPFKLIGWLRHFHTPCMFLCYSFYIHWTAVALTLHVFFVCVFFCMPQYFYVKMILVLLNYCNDNYNI